MSNEFWTEFKRLAKLAERAAYGDNAQKYIDELVRAGVDALAAHYADMNRSLGEYAIALDTMRSAEIGASIRGLKTLASMRDKIDAAVAAAKIQASQTAERVRACIALLPTHPDHAILFPDRVQLCRTKQPEDLAMLVAHRIGEHQKREEQRLREAEERGRQIAEIAAQREAEASARPLTDIHGIVAGAQPSAAKSKPAASGSRIKLGDINAAIAPLSIIRNSSGFHEVSQAAQSPESQMARVYPESTTESTHMNEHIRKTPWTAYSGEDTNGWFVIHDADGYEIGSTDGGFEEPEAKLFAAAPDMAEAIKAAIACGIVPICTASDGGPNRYVEQVRVADMLRAALAKAGVK